MYLTPYSVRYYPVFSEKSKSGRASILFTPRILVEGLGNPPLLALAALRIREA
jgi:hypothetical protein